jgi:3-hexulose-6-phosphate synthase
MELQVALDRFALDEAIALAKRVEPYADWIEVGTSLIKEFGMESVRRMRAALPRARILADVKTNDNARYEFELCYDAGADAATVMGAAPDATVELCARVARERGKRVLIDLLATSPERQRELLRFEDAILGVHVSKDVQESGGAGTTSLAERLPAWVANHAVAVAGGIALGDIDALGTRAPAITVIVGSAITGAADPAAAAHSFSAAMKRYHTQETSA